MYGMGTYPLLAPKQKRVQERSPMLTMRSPLPGVNAIGTRNYLTGSQTDFDGNYSIERASVIYCFFFSGMKSQIPYCRASNTLNVTMAGRCRTTW